MAKDRNLITEMILGPSNRTKKKSVKSKGNNLRPLRKGVKLEAGKTYILPTNWHTGGR